LSARESSGAVSRRPPSPWPRVKLAVLEANPLPGLHPGHSDLPILCTKAGIPYRELISRIVASAAERVA